MSGNVIVFGWKRSLPGREKISAQHFQDFLQYLGGEKQKGTIESFEPVFLEPNGSELAPDPPAGQCTARSGRRFSRSAPAWLGIPG